MIRVCAFEIFWNQMWLTLDVSCSHCQAALELSSPVHVDMMGIPGGMAGLDSWDHGPWCFTPHTIWGPFEERVNPTCSWKSFIDPFWGDQEGTSTKTSRVRVSCLEETLRVGIENSEDMHPQQSPPWHKSLYCVERHRHPASEASANICHSPLPFYICIREMMTLCLNKGAFLVTPKLTFWAIRKMLANWQVF